MFGVAEDLDLSGLIGRKLRQVAVASERIELAFEDAWRVSIECTWRLEHNDEVVASGGRERLLEEVTVLSKLVGSSVSRIHVVPPDRIVLELDSGQQLILIDDSDAFESFSVDPIGIVV